VLLPSTPRLHTPAVLAHLLPPTATLRLSLSEVRLLLRAVLPLPHLDVPAALALVAYQQRHKAAAYRSHRARRLRQLASLANPP